MKKLCFILYLLYSTIVYSQINNEPIRIKKDAFKINILSPAYSNFSFSFQHLFTPYKSFNLTIGYLDFDSRKRLFSIDNRRVQGFSIIPEFRLNLTGYGLNGFYLGPYLRYINYYPEIENTIYTNSTKYNYIEKSNLQSLGIGFVIGKQHIIKNRVLFDYFIGPSYQIILRNTSIIHSESDFLVGISDRYVSGYGIRAGFTVGIAY